MGITYVNAVARGPAGKTAKVRLLVDSGAAYSVLPETVWKKIGLKPKRTECFELADGTTVSREVTECHIQAAGRDGHTPVVLGAAGDAALLGVITLEVLGLVLDPFKRTLQPARLMLA